MFRRNPDAIALIVLGLFMLTAHAPRLVFGQPAEWHVRPLTMELRNEHKQIQTEAERVRNELREQHRMVRDTIRESIDTVRSSIPR
jgi:hypothetical protein